MKLFANENKVNFVDENDVFVGYDLGSICCEYAGWCILPDEDDFDEINNLGDVPQPTNLDGWNFDIEYTSIQDDFKHDRFSVQFRMTKGRDEQFLVLFNVHEGYYSHGFTIKHGDTVIMNGQL